MSRPWPTEIRIRRAAREMAIAFDTGESFVLPAEYLRVNTPSAADRGHGARPLRVPRKPDVALLDAQPVGRYAVRLVFDDGHDTGLYSWDALYALGRDRDANWAKYLAEDGV